MSNVKHPIEVHESRIIPNYKTHDKTMERKAKCQPCGYSYPVRKYPAYGKICHFCQINEEAVLLDTGTGYNLVGPYTIRIMKQQTDKLPNNVLSKTISGNKLPIMAKTHLKGIHTKRTVTLQFCLTKPYHISLL